MSLDMVTLPGLDRSEVVVSAPAPGPGNWAGAASAVLVDRDVWLAYRVRRPVGVGRGVSTVIARSSDGVSFETVTEVFREDFGAASFERPVVLRSPEGTWRLFLSCATPGSKHWWIESLEATTPERLPSGRRATVLPGSPGQVAVKDPVVRIDEDGGWHAWICEHPLSEPGQEDRMSTAYYSSSDGLAWRRHGTVLAPRPGHWDARGARVSDVLSLDPLVVLYDGRASAADNWFETTGIASSASRSAGVLVPEGNGSTGSPFADGAYRYASTVRMPDGRTRLYVEVAREDGAHDLVTVVL
jgi:hypothetical protein